MSKIFFRSLLIITALLLVRADFTYFRGMRGAIGNDFWVYWTGAWVVRSGPAVNLYEAARRPVDASEVFYYDEPLPQPVADKIFVETARSHGIPVRSVYIYPPTLADLLVPLTFVSAKAGFAIWYLLNAAALLGIAALLGLMSGIHRRNRFLIALAFATLLPPVAAALAWGQIPILLLLLLLAGVYLYLRGKLVSAALLFALATAIKLTPLIVIIPLIAWRDWKAVRALLFWCVVLSTAIVAINGWAALQLYFLHEMPKIGTDFILENRSLGTVLQVLFSGKTSGQLSPVVSLVAKTLSLALLGYAWWLCRSGRHKPFDSVARFEVFAAFFFLSACVSPLSWDFGYTLAVPLILLSTVRAWKDSSKMTIGLLVVFGVPFAIYRFHPLFLLTPIAGIVISIASLYRLKRSQGTAPLPSAMRLS